MLVICNHVSFTCYPGCLHKVPHEPVSIIYSEGVVLDCNKGESVCSMIKGLSNKCCCVKYVEVKTAESSSKKQVIEIDESGDIEVIENSEDEE